MDSFISLTVHFIDKDWTLHRWTPYVRYFPDRHTGVNIKLTLDDMIGILDLARPGQSHDIIKYVVNDNAANAVLAIQLSPNLSQVLCAIHRVRTQVS